MTKELLEKGNALNWAIGRIESSISQELKLKETRDKNISSCLNYCSDNDTSVDEQVEKIFNEIHQMKIKKLITLKENYKRQFAKL